MSITSAQPQAGFHGWKILFLATLAQFVHTGFSFYLIGIYIEPLARTFSASVGQLGWTTAIFMVTGTMLGPLLGYWVDKGKARLLLTLGGAVMGTGFLLLAVSATLWQAALACAFFIAPGSAMLSVVVASSMLVQWFDRRRGMVLGIAAAGMSAGGLVTPPVAAWLFGAVGWQTSSLIFGLLIGLVVTPLAWKLAVAKPDQMGQYPDGTATPPQEGADPGAETPGFGQLVIRRDFWFIALTVVAIGFGSFMALTYLVPFAREQGMSLQASAWLLSLYAGAAFAGKPLAGLLADWLPPRRLLTAMCCGMALGLFALVNAPGLDYFLWTTVFFGLLNGFLVPVWSSLIAKNFGPLAFGRVQGGMGVILALGNIVPGPLGGYLADTTGSFSAGFELAAWVLLVGVAMSLFIPRAASRPPSGHPSAFARKTERRTEWPESN